MLPIAWQLAARPVLLVGGGDVATTRVEKLLVADADIHIVAPELSDRIAALAGEHKLTVHQRRYKLGDLTHKRWSVVLTAIPNRELSMEIAEKCRDMRIPVNAADIPEYCDFYFGATIVRDKLQVMITTGGAAPRMARNIRLALEKAVDDLALGNAITKMGQLRAMVREALPDNDPATIKLRMSLISEYCDTTPTKEIGGLTEETMQGVVAGFKVAAKYLASHSLAPEAVPTETAVAAKKAVLTETAVAAKKAVPTETAVAAQKAVSTETAVPAGLLSEANLARLGTAWLDLPDPEKLPSWPPSPERHPESSDSNASLTERSRSSSSDSDPESSDSEAETEPWQGLQRTALECTQNTTAPLPRFPFVQPKRDV